VGGDNLAGFSPQSVSYVSSAEGWVLGTVPCGARRCVRLLHTVNDGAIWSELPAPPIPSRGSDSPAPRVRFADDDDGWVFSTLPGVTTVGAWSTHDGGSRWSPIAFPVKSPYAAGVEDLEAAGGTVQAAVQVGANVDVFSSPVSHDAWRKTGGPFALGAGPVPSGELALQGRTGWFVQNNRVVVSGARLGRSGAWRAWMPPCLEAELSAPSTSDVDAVCTEGVWTGTKISVDFYTSTDGGARFGSARPVPASSADLTAAAGASTVAVATSTSTASSVTAELELSFDGGTAWTTAYRHAGGGWLDLEFTTSSQGVAILAGLGGGPNTMLMSRDGGRAWSTVRFA